MRGFLFPFAGLAGGSSRFAHVGIIQYQYRLSKVFPKIIFGLNTVCEKITPMDFKVSAKIPTGCLVGGKFRCNVATKFFVVEAKSSAVGEGITFVVGSAEHGQVNVLSSKLQPDLVAVAGEKKIKGVATTHKKESSGIRADRGDQTD